MTPSLRISLGLGAVTVLLMTSAAGAQETLLQTTSPPPGPAPWWSNATAGWIGGVLGSLIGLSGALIGILTSRGQGRGLVMAVLNGQLLVGLAALIGGVVALVLAQPYAVYYPLLLVGFLCTVLPLSLRRTIRQRFEQRELRQMSALDA